MSISEKASDSGLGLTETEKIVKISKKKVSWFKRIVNVPNFIFLLIWAASFLPSRYASEMKMGLMDFKAFGVVLILVEAVFILRNGSEDKYRAQNDILGFLYLFFLIWEAGVSRLNLLPYAFVPAPENVFYVFYEDYAHIFYGIPYRSIFKHLLGGLLWEVLIIQHLWKRRSSIQLKCLI